jgi:DNA-binding NarL/FixJ family response regulator
LVGDGDSAIQIAQDFEPDILIIDIFHPGPDGIAVAEWVKQRTPKVRVLILTMCAGKHLQRQLIEAGARGYVMKADAARVLTIAIKTLMENNLFLQPNDF